MIACVIIRRKRAQGKSEDGNLTPKKEGSRLSLANLMNNLSKSVEVGLKNNADDLEEEGVKVKMTKEEMQRAEE